MSIDIAQYQWSEQATSNGFDLSKNFNFDVSSSNGMNESQPINPIIRNKDYNKNYQISEWERQDKIVSQFDNFTGVIRYELVNMHHDLELQSTKIKINIIKKAFSHWPTAAIFKILQVTKKTFYLWQDGETSAKGKNKLRLEKIYSIAKQWALLQKRENQQLPSSLLVTPLGKIPSINQLLCEDKLDPRLIIDLMLKLSSSYKHNVKISNQLSSYKSKTRSTVVYDPVLQLLTIQEEL